MLKQKSTSAAARQQIADIYDGQLHRNLQADNGPLADEHSVSLLLNTDGIVVFHSTSHTMWPVLLMINELPFSKRYM